MLEPGVIQARKCSAQKGLGSKTQRVCVLRADTGDFDHCGRTRTRSVWRSRVETAGTMLSRSDNHENRGVNSQKHLLTR
jgi:hypothetical protein